MSTLPFPSGMLTPSSGLPGWNPANPQGNAVISGAANQVCSVLTTGTPAASPYYAGAAISRTSRVRGKWYAEIALPEFASNVDIAVTPQIDTNAANDFAFGEIPGMGICWGIDQTSWGFGGATSSLESHDLGYDFHNYGSIATLDSHGRASDITQTGGVVMIAMDLDDLLLWFGLNGVWAGFDVSAGLPVAGANPAALVGGVPISRVSYFVGFQAIYGFQQGPGLATATLATKATDFAYPASIPIGFSPFAA